MRARLLPAMASLVATLGAGAGTAAADDLPGGWVEHVAGGETICARGAPYSFFVNPGTSKNVIIDFIGGGACWSAETCAASAGLFTDSVDSLRDMAANGIGGVYDRTDPKNPYREWTHVAVPYCTGDVHWGESDVDYKNADGTTFTIHHRGATNAKAVLAYVKTVYPDAPKVLVTGCSGGAYGAAYWTPQVREDFPHAQVREFGDSGVGVATPDFLRTSVPLWNVTANAPRWIPALDPAHNDWGTLGLQDFYERAAAYYPDVTFAQYNSAFDFVQTLFYDKMGGNAADWSGQMFGIINHLDAKVPNFRSFIGPGDTHCATIGSELYSLKAQGTSVRDWLDEYVNGATVPASLRCAEGACGSP